MLVKENVKIALDCALCGFRLQSLASSWVSKGEEQREYNKRCACREEGDSQPVYNNNNYYGV